MLRILKADQQDGVVQTYDYTFDFTEDRPSQELEEDDFSEDGESDIEEEITASPSPKNSMEVQSGKIISQAKKKAEEILDEAEEQAELIAHEARDAGYQEGFDKGYQEGLEKAEQEGKEKMEKMANEFLAHMKDIIEDIEEKKEDVLQKHCGDLKDIAVAVAEKVIHVGLKSSGEVIEKMIIAATEKIKNKQWAKIYIAKCDASLMMQGDSDLLKAISHVSDHIKIVVMENESPGTCIIELPDEIIDASANAQVENIKGILNSASI